MTSNVCVKVRFHEYIADHSRRLTRTTDEEYLKRIERGQVIESPVEMSPTVYKLYAVLLFMQYVAEWWGAKGYEDAFKKDIAPPEDRPMLERMYKEEYGHARLVWLGDGKGMAGPLSLLDIDPTLFLAENPQEQIYLLHIFQHPGFIDLPDLIAFNFLQDQTADHQLDDISKGSFGPWTRIINIIEAEEEAHVEHGERWLARLTKTPKSRAIFQMRLNQWFPHALDVFGQPDVASKNTALYLKFGIKQKTNDRARRDFVSAIKPILSRHGLTLPGWEYRENRSFRSK